MLVALRQSAPASTVGHVVGIRDNRPFSGFCKWHVRSTVVGDLPSGKVVCASYRPTEVHRRAELDQLAYHALSRDVYHADRSWEPLNEQSWRSDVDSIRNALKKQGGIRLCSREGRTAARRVEEVWRFPDFDLDLSAGSIPAGEGGRRRWYLFLFGKEDLHVRCAGVRAQHLSPRAARVLRGGLRAEGTAYKCGMRPGSSMSIDSEISRRHTPLSAIVARTSDGGAGQEFGYLPGSAPETFRPGPRLMSGTNG